MLFCIAQNSPDLKIKWMENSQVYRDYFYYNSIFHTEKRKEMLEQKKKKNKLIQMGSPRIIVRYFY